MPVFICDTCKDSGKIGFFWNKKPCPKCNNIKLSTDNINKTQKIKKIEIVKKEVEKKETNDGINFYDKQKPIEENKAHFKFDVNLNSENKEPIIDVQIFNEPMMFDRRIVQIKVDNMMGDAKKININVSSEDFVKSKYHVKDFMILMKNIENKIEPIILDKHLIKLVMEEMCRVCSYEYRGIPLPPKPPHPRYVKSIV